jgi:hypothetical protein
MMPLPSQSGACIASQKTATIFLYPTTKYLTYTCTCAVGCASVSIQPGRKNIVSHVAQVM